MGPSHFLTRKPWGRGCPRGHFYFLHFIYFQTVFCVSSSSSDASTYFQIETPCSVDFFHDTFAYKKKVVPCLGIFFLLDEETSSGNWRRERNAHRVVRKKKPSKGGEKKDRYRILTGELWINFEIDTKERWCSRQLYCTCSWLDHRNMKSLLVLFTPTLPSRLERPSIAVHFFTVFPVMLKDLHQLTLLRWTLKKDSEKKTLYLSVNVFSTKVLILDTIFTSPTGDLPLCSQTLYICRLS